MHNEHFSGYRSYPNYYYLLKLSCILPKIWATWWLFTSDENKCMPGLICPGQCISGWQSWLQSFLVSRQNLGDLSSTENECPICPLTIRGCVRRKPSICICSCAHPFAKKNSAHLIQREGESHLSLAMHCCVRKNIISVFVVVLNFWPTRKNGRLSSKDNDEGPIRP